MVDLNKNCLDERAWNMMEKVASTVLAGKCECQAVYPDTDRREIMWRSSETEDDVVLWEKLMAAVR